MTSQSIITPKSANPGHALPLTRDHVHDYLQQIGRIPLITPEQEIDLGRKVQRLMALISTKEALALKLDRDPTNAEWANAAELSEEELSRAIAIGNHAKKRMTEANLRLVVAIAKKYTKCCGQLQMMDLVQEGGIGLQRGVEKFDPSKGYKFSTYAYWWIRQAITRAIAQSRHTIRLPVHVGELRSRINKVIRKFQKEGNGAIPDINTIAELLDVPVEKVKLVLSLQETVSLDKFIKSDEKENTVLTTIASDDPTPMDYAIAQDLRAECGKFLSMLPDNQKRIIRMRHGLDDGKAKTLLQVGTTLGVSRERIRQIEQMATRKLKREIGRRYSSADEMLG